MLEDALERARAGEIVSLAAAFVTSTACTAQMQYVPDRPIAMIGALRVLEREIIDQAVDLGLHQAGIGY